MAERVEEVKLIGSHGSPFSCRVEMALKIKGVPYEFIEEDIFNKSSLLLQHNPIHKKIPVLLHNGKPIAESQVILEYIEETWEQNPILPQDPYAKAMARFWAKFIDDSCMPAVRKAFWSKGEEQEKAVQVACEHLKILENELQDKNSKFFGGESAGFVDIVANFLGFWNGVIEEVSGVKLLTEDKFPLLFKWSNDFVNCNFNKEILTPGLRDDVFGFFQARFHDQYFQVK